MDRKKAFLINVAYYGFFAVLIFLAWRFIWPVLLPFILAFIIASFLQKPSEKLAGKVHCQTKWAGILLLLVFYLLIFGAFFMGGGQIFSTVSNFITNLPRFYQSTIVPFLDSVSLALGDMLADTDASLAGEVQMGLQQFEQNIGETLSSLSVSALRIFSGFVTGVPSVVIRLIIMIVSSFYMTSDYQRIMDLAGKYLPEKVKKAGKDIKQYGWNILKAYLKSYSLLFLLTFVELTVGLLILRVPYAVGVALAIAIFDILPVLGTGGILLPWMVVMLVMGDYPFAAGLLILYIVITIVRNSLEPRIVGKQVGLHPLITLIAMFTGLELAGIVGMILVPLTVVILVNMEKNGALHLFHKPKVEDAGK